MGGVLFSGGGGQRRGGVALAALAQHLGDVRPGYRRAPNTGSRKSWAAGDASSRGVRLALIALTGEMGYPSALTAKTWGFQDSLFRGNELKLSQPFASYVMENILFKISFPAEFHAQTAVECALALHDQVKDRIERIERIEIETQEAGCRIIDKTGPLDNFADRDHCLQYMVAVPLLRGRLSADDYTDAGAADPRIDWLRARTRVKENPRFTRELVVEVPEANLARACASSVASAPSATTGSTSASGTSFRGATRRLWWIATSCSEHRRPTP